MEGRETDFLAIGQRIRCARKEKKLTQLELARRVGLSVSCLGYIERGTRVMSIDTLAQLCQQLDLDAHFVIFGTRNADWKSTCAINAIIGLLKLCGRV